MLIDKNELLDMVRGNEGLSRWQKEEVIKCIDFCKMYNKHKLIEDGLMNKWTPCSESLPTKMRSYLVTKYMSKTSYTPERYAVCSEIFWTTDKKWDCERDEDYMWKVIAWMEVPTSYKKGE